MTSCSSYMDEEPVVAGIPDEIKIEVSVADAASRAGYTSANLDKIDLVIFNNVNSDFSYSAVCSKVGMSWMADKSMAWDQARSTVSVAAVAPSRGLSSLSTLSISVPAFYGAESDVKNADFLLMRRDIDPKADLTADGKLPISLSHMLSKFTIDFGGAEVSNVKVEGTVLTGKCNLRREPATVEVSDDMPLAIAPFKTAQGTYECMIVPQTAAKLTVTFRAGGHKYRWTPSGEVTFAPNTAYTLPLSVSAVGKAKGQMRKARY